MFEWVVMYKSLILSFVKKESNYFARSTPHRKLWNTPGTCSLWVLNETKLPRRGPWKSTTAALSAYT